MLLNDCLTDSRLKAQPANHAEIARLLAVADRDLADYDRIDVVSKQDLAKLLTDTLAFRDETLEWLRREHPELV